MLLRFTETITTLLAGSDDAIRVRFEKLRVPYGWGSVKPGKWEAWRESIKRAISPPQTMATADDSDRIDGSDSSATPSFYFTLTDCRRIQAARWCGPIKSAC